MSPSRLLVLLLAVAALASAAVAPLAGAAQTTLNDIEDEVMCQVCGVPLNIAESAQADRERAYIRGLIAKGESKSQVKRDLVAQYGDSVLALPPRKGFNLAVYIVPALLVASLLAIGAVLVPRWRRRSRGPDSLVEHVPALGAADARRLEQDLARFDG
jgi:cytochrome c-type biogenesis protein CcmH